MVCQIVDNLYTIPYEIYKNGKVLQIEVVLVEMLKNENTYSQVLYESFAAYYCNNSNSYQNLTIPKTLRKKVNLLHGRREFIL